MAKKGATKAPPTFDIYTLTKEQKDKVYNLSDQFPELTKQHLGIVLEHHNFDSDKAVDSLVQDGGKEAKESWLTMQNNQTKTNFRNKKRNKKKNNKKDNGTLTSTPAPCTDADDSSSLHSSNIDFDGEKENATKIDDCDEVNDCTENEPSSICSTLSPTCDELSLLDTVSGNQEANSTVRTVSEISVEDRRNSSISATNSVDISAGGDVPNCVTPDTSEATSSPLEKQPEEQPRYTPQKTSYKQRHGSSYGAKTNFEEFSSEQSASTQKKAAAYQKCKKDLSRQAVSLPRIQSQLDQHLEDASKCMKNAFAELRKMLDERQALHEQELEKVKNEALLLLRSRQDLAADLKLRSDRNLSDAEWNDLKADIKQFVTERKYDDELGRTIWFQYANESIIEEIGKFGEVSPVKNSYSQRQHPRAQSSTEPSSPISLLGSDETPMAACNIDDATSTEGSSEKTTEEAKIEKPDFQFKHPFHTENRSRTFSNSQKHFSNNYQQNYGGGRYYNNRGRGFHPKRHMNNYVHRGQNRQFSNSDYKHHYVQHERTEFHPLPEDRSAEASMNMTDNNSARYPPMSHRDNQPHYRGGRDMRSFRRPNMPNRLSNSNRGRGNSRPPRHASDNASATSNVDKNANYNPEVPQESKDMTNGY